MLLKKLNVTNSRGSTMELPLENPSAGFIVRDISGLDPVKATLVSSSFANMDGEQYHSSRREARNIVVRLGLSPDYAQYSVYDLRAQLYNFFLPKSQVVLNFRLLDKFNPNIIDQILDLEIIARVESFEVELFTQDPAVELSLMCFDPDFVDPTQNTFEGSTVNDLSETVLDYTGQVETGVLFTILPDRAMSDFAVYHRPPDNTLKTVYFEYPLLADDRLEISSIMGAKSVILTRSGVESSLLYALSPQSAWLELYPGENNIRVYNDGAPVPYTIDYTNKYGGL